MFRLIWRAYARAALLPLLCIEVLLVLVYLWTNSAIRDANVASLRDIADRDLQAITTREAQTIERRLQGVAQLARVLQAAARDAALRPGPVPPAEAARYSMAPSGVYHTVHDDGGAAAFYSAITTVGPAERLKLQQLAQIDPVMRYVHDADPLVVQSYYNTHDSANRIYPYFDTLAQYDTYLDIPRYSFYYAADAAHNPTRGVSWTDAYVDPAGRGWMISAVAPVYRGDFLEGVVGLDITLATLVAQVLDLALPWQGYGMLIDRGGTILAMPQAGERDLDMRELGAYEYAEAIREEARKPAEFELVQHLPDVARAIEAGAAGTRHLQLAGGRIATWQRIAATGWTLLTFVDEARVYAEVLALEAHYEQVGYRLIALMVLFYLLFFGFLYLRARRMAHAIAEPLERFSALARAVGDGHYDQSVPASGVRELDDAGQALASMGHHLGEAVERLSEAKRQAEEANDAKSRFLSQMSHELRTPLNAICGFAQLLDMSRGRIAPELHECIDDIREGGRHLLDLISQLLDLSLIETGRLQLAPEDVDLDALVRRTTASLEPLMAARAIDVTFTPALPSAQVLVSADPVRVRQVLVNLLSNAVKYNRDGGSIRISAARVRAGRARVTISDEGPGVPDAAREWIFEPFHRLASSNQVEGAGIGLAICRSLLAAMGGRIGVEAGDGGGACFWFELPVVRSAGAGGVRSAAGPAGATGAPGGAA
ncbi:MAG: ATP-binding protein [Gammaproteobacteria bacterium]